MNRLTLTSISLVVLGTPAFGADLDGPEYRERDTYIERPAPTVIERERIIEHHYYYAPRETYVAPRVYERPVHGYGDAYYDDGYRYRRPAYFFAAPLFWPHRHRGW